jgi:hypothetical protein
MSRLFLLCNAADIEARRNYADVISIRFRARAGLETVRAQPQGGRVPRPLRHAELLEYDGDTGLHAARHLEHAAGEAMRFGRTFTCVSLWAPTVGEIRDLTERLRTRIRAEDVAAYLGDGHFAILMMDTTIRGAETVLSRMFVGVKGVTGGCAVATTDGRTFAEVLASAKARSMELTFEDAA